VCVFISQKEIVHILFINLPICVVINLIINSSSYVLPSSILYILGYFAQMGWAGFYRYSMIIQPTMCAICTVMNNVTMISENG